ncbi:hypothetical protein ACTA71_012334 [Dictyostelium dimigraforme]
MISTEPKSIQESFNLSSNDQEAQCIVELANSLGLIKRFNNNNNNNNHSSSLSSSQTSLPLSSLQRIQSIQNSIRSNSLSLSSSSLLLNSIQLQQPQQLNNINANNNNNNTNNDNNNNNISPRTQLLNNTTTLLPSSGLEEIFSDRNKIGEGGQCSIYKYMGTAMKRFKPSLRSLVSIEFENEVLILERLNHPSQPPSPLPPSLPNSLKVIKIFNKFKFLNQNNNNQNNLFIWIFTTSLLCNNENNNNNQLINKSVDVFSFGIMLWECLNWRSPYESLSKGTKSHLSKGIQDLIRLCWKRDPSIRPSFIEIRSRLSDFK